MENGQIKSNFKIVLILFIFINLIQAVNSEPNYFSRNLDLDYTHALSLLNGNIFIIHKNGVIVYNYNFTIILYSYDFGGNQLIQSEVDNNFTSLIQCNDGDQYVLAIINTKIYIFSSRGEYLFQKSTNLFSDFKTEVVYQYYSFIYYKNAGPNYFFIVSFINDQNLIKLILFQININNKLFIINKEQIITEITDITSDSVSCQTINYQEYTNCLSCFFMRKMDNFYYMLLSLFNIEKNFTIIRNESIFKNDFVIDNCLIKSNVMKGKNKVFVIFIYQGSQTFLFFKFDFDSYQYNGVGYGNQCSSGTKLINIDYFEYVEKFVYSCEDSNGISLLIINEDSNVNTNFIIRYNTYDCNKFTNYDIIFLRYVGIFSLITNFFCDGSSSQIYDFPYNIISNVYSLPTDEPESSFFFTNFSATTTVIQETTIPLTTIKGIKTTIPMTTIKRIETTVPITTIKGIETTLPITTIKEIKTTTPITTNKEVTTITPTTLVTNLIQTTSPFSTEIIQNTKTISSTIYEKNCQLKCLDCDSESSHRDLCIKCNTNEGYYPSVVLGEKKYVNCYNKDTKPLNYFFNNDKEYYEPCYSKCKTCEYQGNEDVNNCTSCKSNYIFRPDEPNTSNCVKKCKYYFYISFGQYHCTENNQCPIISSLLIKSRGQCIDECKNDNEFKFQFNYDCLKECPEETFNDNNICKLKDIKKCYLYSDSLVNVDFIDLNSTNFTILIKRYIVGFEDTDFHVDFYKNQDFTITIYKTMYCLKELEIISTIIDFHECYEKVQKHYNLEGISLIILIADFLKNNKLINTLFYFFHPLTGKILSIDGICNEETFTIEKSLDYFPEINKEQAKFFQEQNIDIFNTSDVFYNDLCCFFKSPNGKDVPLKERILLFYPNVTLCDESCYDAGVNLTSMKAICECKLKSILNEAKETTKLVGLDYSDLIDSLSIIVLKCFETVFQYKYFIKCYGGFISIFLIIIQSICVIIYYKKSINEIRRRSLSLMENYSYLLLSSNSLQSPPKRNIKTSVSPRTRINIYNSNSCSQNESINKINPHKISTSKNLLFSNKKHLKTFVFKKKKSKRKLNKKIPDKKENKSLNNSGLLINREIEIKEYLATSMDDLDYDELIIREKRSFWSMFFDKLVANQKIIDLFYNSNWIIPRTIRIIFLIVMIGLYFLVNALFYNEAYIKDLYYLKKEETFFSFVPRSLNRIFYTTISSTVLDFIISLLFPIENKIKKIMIRKKNNLKEMKNKIIISIKNIINNYKIFIIVSYVFTIFSWYYYSCFNNVYPYLKIEWIKSSIFIFIVIQLMIILGCFVFALLRFIGIKCKNERIFRISNYFFSK